MSGNEDILRKAAADIDIEVLGYIPQDENIAYHDLTGKSLLELPEAPALYAARKIVSEYIFPERFK